jgi:hypothetical protein
METMRLIKRFAAIGAASSLVFAFACSTDTFVDSDASADGAVCPDETGQYDITLSGGGCPKLGTTLGRVCVTQSGCLIAASSASTAFSGMVTITASGGFSDGAIDEGPLMRTGCDGAWSTTNAQLTVTCGGMDGGQSCVATLTRTAGSC